MSILATIDGLNTQLAQINRDRDRALAQQDYLKKACIDKLTQLKEETGLDALSAFQSGDPSASAQIIGTALKKEEASLQAKAELATQLVEAFNNQEYFRMNELLGLTVNEKSISEEYREAKAEEAAQEVQEKVPAVEEEVPVVAEESPIVAEESPAFEDFNLDVEVGEEVGNIDFNFGTFESAPSTPTQGTATAVGEVDDLVGFGVDMSTGASEPAKASAPASNDEANANTFDMDIDFDF